MKLGVTQESGRSEIRNNSGLGPLEGELILSGGTKNLNEIEIEISAEEVFRIIKDDLVRVKGEIAKAGNITLEQYLNLRRLKLSEQPIIDNSFFNQALMWISAEEEEQRFSWVETDKIVGRPFAQDFSDGWSHEYHSRTGRIVQIATNLLRGVLQDRDDMVKAAIDHVFHHQNKPYERIQLFVLEGPGGPIYLVEDGTHRVAAAKLLGLKRIPCSVRRIKYPLKQTTTDREMFEYWQRAINLGLIQGSSNIVNMNGSTTRYEIQVTSELFPWVRVCQHKFLRINQIYEKVYPDSLRNLPIPRDALLDEVANNHFMAGPKKWQEWVQKFSNKPRDKDGLVAYY